MADLESLLLRTSRTFALSIPRLPEPLRRQVTVAYLLFRVADTLEDAFRWDRDRRLAALQGFAAVLRGELEAATLASAWRAHPPCDHAGYLELLQAIPELLQAFASLEEEAGQRISAHVLRTAAGMERFVAGASRSGELQLRSFEELRGYCYVVAGIVGELLTELFLLAEPIPQAAEALRREAVAFGEGLQLVNVLKDAAADAGEGRIFLPPELRRERLFTRARRDLQAGRRYVLALQEAQAAEGVVAFCALPVLLAEATLDRVEREGPGAKVDRDTVAAIAASLEIALASGGPAC